MLCTYKGKETALRRTIGLSTSPTRVPASSTCLGAPRNRWPTAPPRRHGSPAPQERDAYRLRGQRPGEPCVVQGRRRRRRPGCLTRSHSTPVIWGRGQGKLPRIPGGALAASAALVPSRAQGVASSAEALCVARQPPRHGDALPQSVLPK